jgi:hypothetical protein
MNLTLEQARMRAFAKHFFDHTEDGDLVCRCGARVARIPAGVDDYTAEFDLHRAEIAFAMVTGRVKA